MRKAPMQQTSYDENAAVCSLQTAAFLGFLILHNDINGFL